MEEKWRLGGIKIPCYLQKLESKNPETRPEKDPPSVPKDGKKGRKKVSKDAQEKTINEECCDDYPQSTKNIFVLNNHLFTLELLKLDVTIIVK